jgi:predicted transcriptional regulator
MVQVQLLVPLTDVPRSRSAVLASTIPTDMAKRLQEMAHCSNSSRLYIVTRATHGFSIAGAVVRYSSWHRE